LSPLEYAFKKVSNLFRESGLDINQKPFPIESDLIVAIAKHVNLQKGTTIKVVDIRNSSKIIYGYIRHYKHKIDIGVLESLNHCWTRYVTCKEISHILLGSNGDGVTGDPRDIINGFYEKMLCGQNAAYDHEHLAMICAAEIMMPYEVSQSLLEDDIITSIDIALQFKIPLALVKIYKNKKFLETRKEIYTNL
jgi:hypothetical protein